MVACQQKADINWTRGMEMGEISGRETDLLMAKPIVPTVLALLYGGYKFFDLGFGSVRSSV